MKSPCPPLSVDRQILVFNLLLFAENVFVEQVSQVWTGLTTDWVWGRRIIDVTLSHHCFHSSPEKALGWSNWFIRLIRFIRFYNVREFRSPLFLMLMFLIFMVQLLLFTLVRFKILIGFFTHHGAHPCRVLFDQLVNLTCAVYLLFVLLDLPLQLVNVLGHLSDHELGRVQLCVRAVAYEVLFLSLQVT